MNGGEEDGVKRERKQREESREEWNERRGRDKTTERSGVQLLPSTVSLRLPGLGAKVSRQNFNSR